MIDSISINNLWGKIKDTVAKKHTQNTDTQLKSGVIYINELDQVGITRSRDIGTTPATQSTLYVITTLTGGPQVSGGQSIGHYVKMEAPDGQKAFMYGVTVDVLPKVEQVPNDVNTYDVNGFTTTNIGRVKAQSGLFIGGSDLPTTSTNPRGYAWTVGIELSGSAQTGIYFNPPQQLTGYEFDIGIDFRASRFYDAAIKLDKNQLVAFNTVGMWCDANNVLQIQGNAATGHHNLQITDTGGRGLALGAVDSEEWGDIQALNSSGVGDLVLNRSGGKVCVCGIGPNYDLDVKGTFGCNPGSSVTPILHGDVVLELTNDTTLTLKARGSDGVVRSAALTLS